MIISRKYKRFLSWVCMIPLKIEFYKKDLYRKFLMRFKNSILIDDVYRKFKCKRFIFPILCKLYYKLNIISTIIFYFEHNISANIK